MTRRPSILYIGAILPSRSETFVYREVLALRSRGWSVYVASVHRPERGLDDSALEELADEAIQIYDEEAPSSERSGSTAGGKLRLLGRASCEIMRHPIRSIGTMARAKLDALTGSVPLSRRFKIIWQGAAALSIAQACRNRGIAHVHAHMAHVPTTIAMYLARQLGVPFSFTGHAADLFRDRSLLEKKLERAAFCACISQWHRSFYQQLVQMPPERLPIIRCGVDVKSFTPPDSAAQGSLLHILSVGRLVPKKGFDLLIEALAAVSSRMPQWRCTVVGSGPEESRLRALVRRHGLVQQVTLAGAKPNSDVRALLQSADLFVLPCRIDGSGDRDGIPVVLMEAMACSVPVIAGDLPTIRELVVHEESGITVDAESHRDLEVALVRLAGSPEERERLGRAGREQVEREFSEHVNIARLESALMAVVAVGAAERQAPAAHEPKKSEVGAPS